MLVQAVDALFVQCLGSALEDSPGFVEVCAQTGEYDDI